MSGAKTTPIIKSTIASITELSDWQLTPWVMNGRGGWKQPPIITIEGEVPFFADHPKDYMRKLKTMHADPTITRGNFHTLIGQLRDGLEWAWDTELK